MCERGMSTLGAVLLAAAGGLLVGLVLTQWMVVEVQTGPPDDVHLVVPFPLWAARLATSAVSSADLPDLELPPEARMDRAALLTALDELQDAGDALLVEVREPGTHVQVRTEGGYLVVEVEEAPDTSVRCRLPLAGAVRALERWDGETLDPRMVFDLLNGGDGDLVQVVDGATRVAIRIR